MDVSLEYQKMCDCDEIQNDGHKTLMTGDFAADRAQHYKVIVDNGKPYYKKYYIKLPRQDQLQIMVMEYLWGETHPANRISALLQKFIWWLDATLPKFDSMEQLWLAFVMKERHQKIWSGTEWVKGNNGN